MFSAQSAGVLTRAQPEQVMQTGPRRPGDVDAVHGSDAPWQEAPVLEPVASFGGRIRVIVPTGPRIWLAQSNRVYAVDGSEPESLRRMGTELQLPDVVHCLDVQGERGLACAGDRLFLLDLGRPEEPRIEQELALADGQRVVKGILAGDRIFVDIGADVDVIEISSGRTLQAGLVGDPNAIVHDLARFGDQLVLSTRDARDARQSGYLRWYPLTPEPGPPGQAYPERMRVEEMAAGHLSVARVDGADRVFTSFYLGQEIAVWESREGSEPRRLQTWRGHSPWRASAVGLPNGEVYVPSYRDHGNSGGVEVTIRHLTTDGFEDIGGMPASRHFHARLVAWGDRHLLTGDDIGLLIVDIASEPPDWRHMPAAVEVAGLEPAGESGLLVANQRGALLVFDLSEPDAPSIRAHLESIAGFTGLVADEVRAIWSSHGPFDIPLTASSILDLSSPTDLEAVGHFSGVHHASASFDLDEGWLVAEAIDTSAAVAIYAMDDLVDAHEPPFVDREPIEGEVLDLVMDEGLVVVSYADTSDARQPRAQRKLRLRVLGLVTEGAERRLERRSDLWVGDGTGQDLLIEGDVLWLTTHQPCGVGTSLLVGVDLSEPSRPRLRSWIPVPYGSRPVALHEGHLFLAGPTAAVVDLRNPDAPRLVSRLAHGASDVVVVGRRVYAADLSDGIWVYQPDLPWSGDPSHPSPSPPPISTPGASPTPSPTVDCRPTATPSPELPATSTSTAVATEPTADSTATPTSPDVDPTGRAYLPLTLWYPRRP